MHIRPATPADISAMRELERHAAMAGHWTEAQYESIFRLQPRRLVFVVEDHGALQGFIVAVGSGPEWELENIAVAEAARRRGLGAALLAHLLEQVQQEGAAGVFLEVRESNAAARALYEKWSFTETGRRRHYYSDPEEDAIVYRRSFSR